MMRSVFNRWSRLHAGWKTAAAVTLSLNALSFTESFMATRNTLYSFGLAFPFEAYNNPLKAKWLIVPNGIANGAIRGVTGHTQLWLLEGYCNAPSPAFNVISGVHRLTGDAGVIAFNPVYGVVGTPGAVLGGMVAGGSVAVQELATGGEYFHLHPCAGSLPFKPLSLWPSQNP